MLQTDLEQRLETALYALEIPLGPRVYGGDESVGASIDRITGQEPDPNFLARMKQELGGEITERQHDVFDGTVSGVKRTSRFEDCRVSYDLDPDDGTNYAKGEDIDEILRRPDIYFLETLSLSTPEFIVLVHAERRNGKYKQEVIYHKDPSISPGVREDQVQEALQKVNEGSYDPRKIVEFMIDLIKIVREQD